MSDTLENFIEKLFSEPPKEPWTVQLDLHTNDTSPMAIAEFLSVVFTKGTVYLFGDDEGQVNLSSLTDENFGLIKQYFNSFGFDILYQVMQMPFESTRFVSHGTLLRDINLHKWSEGRTYILSFDVLERKITNKKKYF